MRLRIMTLLAIAGVPTFAAAGILSLEPSPPETGAELVLHLSSDFLGSCWAGPLPFLKSSKFDPDALSVFLSSTDYVECLAQPLDIKYFLGVVPPGVTHVEIFGCGDNPIPGTPACASVPFFVVDVSQGIFKNSFE
jgi:hypothetical protein